MNAIKFRHRPMKWVWFLTVFLSLMILAGCKNSHEEKPTKPAPLPEVGTVTIEPQSVELTVELPGRTTAYRVAEIRPQVNGIIQKRLFEEGASVNAGDLLYQIDPAPFKAALNSAKASLGKALANLPAAESRADRYKALLAQDAVSQQDYDDADAACQQVKAEIDYWRAQVDSAQISLNYTKVTAPISGQISRSNVTDGALVTAYQAIPLATIQQLNPIYVDVAQSTAELLALRRRLASGQIRDSEKDSRKVEILMEDKTAYPLEGRLQFRDVTSVDPSTGSYIMRITVPNPDYLLLPGMFVRAVVKEGTADRAILVPQEGVTRNPKGEAIAWIVAENNTVEQRKLIVDRAVGNKWLLNSGLSAGDRVIVEGRLNVRPGAKVKAVSLGAQLDTQKADGSSISQNNPPAASSN